MQAGWIYILALTLVLPALALRSAFRIRAGQPLPPRSALHTSTILVLAILLTGALFVARREHVQLFPPFQPGWRDAAAIFGFLAITLAVLLFKLRRLTGAHRAKLERITMSDWRDPRQLLSYSIVAVMAGIAEELAYRGVLFELLLRPTGNWFAAAGIASVAFGAAHAVQGWRSAVAIAGFALLFHVLVLVTGNLYAAIFAHAAYDLTAGILIAHTRRAGPPQEPPGPVPPTAG